MRNLGSGWARTSRYVTGVSLAAVVLSGGIAAVDRKAEQDKPAVVREWAVVAKRYSFTPSLIEVNHGEIVKITLRTEDIPHSFTIDEYRISKRVAPNHPVFVEFCANRRGRFTFYCNLTIEEGCRNMRGTLVVR